MEPTPEERKIMAAADWSAENHPLRKRFSVAIGGFLLLCLLAAALSSRGPDRLLFGAMAVCIVA